MYVRLHVTLSIGCQSSVDKSSSGRLSLGEQAAGLQASADRLVALKRVTAAAQVLLARTMVMRALSLLSVRLVCLVMWLFIWDLIATLKCVFKLQVYCARFLGLLNLAKCFDYLLIWLIIIIIIIMRKAFIKIILKNSVNFIVKFKCLGNKSLY